jgi:hypothetical protein
MEEARTEPEAAVVVVVPPFFMAVTFPTQGPFHPQAERAEQQRAPEEMAEPEGREYFSHKGFFKFSAHVLEKGEGKNMEQLSEHFADSELRVAGQEQRIIGNAKFLCIQILEPLREKFGALLIHSGYRDPAHNESVGGVHGSFHLYAGDECAADFAPLPTASASLELIFDWMRLESNLPFDHVILEHDRDGHPACIHVQAHVEFANRRPRGAYLRSTGAAHDTVECDCVNA